MSPAILILSEPRDGPAFVVAEALRRKGVEPILWQTSDFPTRARVSVTFGDGAMRIRATADDRIGDTRFTTVWYRRARVVPGADELHPADRDFAAEQCREFRRGLWDILEGSAFWVNPAAAARAANRKVLQHHLAVELDLRIPATLIGNDPDAVRAFLREHGGTIVYKPIDPGAWRVGDRDRAVYTSTITEAQLPGDRMLELAPGIYQAIVPKAYEVRLTVMGARGFGAALHSQETDRGRLDYRRAYDQLRIEMIDVPPAILERCRAMLARLGLVTGCFDFIVTPEGEWIFLEVNEAGQFLWIEAATGFPLVDAFAEMLRQGAADFRWDPERAMRGRIDVADAMRRAAVAHVVPVERLAHEP